MSGREDYSRVISDAALWLFRKYYRIREFATFEPGPPTKPNPFSRMGMSEVGDVEAELWIYALKRDLFRRAEASEGPTEKYLREAFHNCVKTAVTTGLTRRRLLDDSVSNDKRMRMAREYEDRLDRVVSEDEEDMAYLLDGPGSYSDDMQAEHTRQDTGTNVSPTSYYSRGASPEMNEDVRPSEVDERILAWA